MYKRAFSVSLLVLQLSVSALVGASESDPEQGFYVYQLCADCHSREGWGTEDGQTPVIAGQHPSVLIKQLRDFREGRRSNDAMYPFSQEEAIGGEQAIADVVAYISTLPMQASPTVGSGKNLHTGSGRYMTLCADCHGSKAEGSNTGVYPRLQSQHYTYLVAQIEAMISGARTDVNAAMMDRLQNLSRQDIEAIADYISRIPPPEELLAPEGWENADFNYGIQ